MTLLQHHVGLHGISFGDEQLLPAQIQRQTGHARQRLRLIAKPLRAEIPPGPGRIVRHVIHKKLRPRAPEWGVLGFLSARQRSA